MKIRTSSTRTGTCRLSAVRLSSAPRLGARRAPEGAEMRHLLRGPATTGTNNPGVVQVHADHAVVGQVQLAPVPPRTAPAKVPTLTAPQTTRFFSDLNAALKKMLGVDVRLALADFSVLGASAFAAFLKRTPDTSSDYLAAVQLAQEICAAKAPAEFAALCGTDQQCIGKVRRIQADPRLCLRGQPTEELVLQSIGTRGVTPAAGGPSVVIEESTRNDMLRNVVHEGVHRMRGAVWKARSVIGAGYTHSRERPPVRLAHIDKPLDEGTTQIITLLAIGELQAPRGSWFSKSYAPTTYVDEMKKVWKMLADHGHSVDTSFLIRAYTAASDATGVEDLQLWQ